MSKVFKFVKSMKKDGKDVEGGRCMRGSEGSLNFSGKMRTMSGIRTFKHLTWWKGYLGRGG